MVRRVSLKHFGVKLSLFLLPIALYVAIGVVLPVYLGEYIPLRDIAQMQMGEEQTVFGQGHRDDFRIYKFISTELRQPNVLALGSSRVMQFRSEIFDNPSTFYNAGGGASNILEMQTFLEELPETYEPDLLIIGIDQDWFNPNTTRIHSEVVENRGGFNEVINYSRQMFSALLTHDFDWARLLNRRVPLRDDVRAIGVSAAIGGSGFRNDGSQRYYLSTDSTEERLADVVVRLETSGFRFEFADQYDTEAFATLVDLVERCRARGINVVGFLPPYPPSIYSRMVENGNHHYMMSLSGAAADLFADNDYPFYDFGDGGEFVNLGDDTYIDGFHGGEWVYLQMFVRMLQDNPELLGPYANLERLQQLLASQRENALIAFD